MKRFRSTLIKRVVQRIAASCANNSRQFAQAFWRFKFHPDFQLIRRFAYQKNPDAASGNPWCRNQDFTRRQLIGAYANLSGLQMLQNILDVIK